MLTAARIMADVAHDENVAQEMRNALAHAEARAGEGVPAVITIKAMIAAADHLTDRLEMGLPVGKQPRLT